MAHYSVLTLYNIIILVLLQNSSAIQDQYFEKPRTAILESVPIDNTIISDERGDQGVIERFSETCAEPESIIESSSPEDQLSPDFKSVSYTPNSDPYLRRTFYNGQYYPYSAYNMYQDEYLKDMIRERDFYNNIWYPYKNPSVYEDVPYSNIPPIQSLPPVYTRLYGNSGPIDQDWFPNHIRRQRRLDADEELMKQLEYDSIMKNILPTMYIPLPRDASVLQSTLAPYSYATYPGGTADCSLPILLGCTPTITYGNNMDNQNFEPVTYEHVYRNLLNKNVHDHVEISDDKMADDY